MSSRTAKSVHKRFSVTSVRVLRAAGALVPNFIIKELCLIYGSATRRIKIIDFTGVQAGPACTQLLAWFGADVLKVERPGVGDVTRNQLRDVPDLDALYFTMLNSNKRSLELDTKTPHGKG